MVARRFNCFQHYLEISISFAAKLNFTKNQQLAKIKFTECVSNLQILDLPILYKLTYFDTTVENLSKLTNPEHRLRRKNCESNTSLWENLEQYIHLFRWFAINSCCLSNSYVTVVWWIYQRRITRSDSYDVSDVKTAGRRQSLELTHMYGGRWSRYNVTGRKPFWCKQISYFVEMIFTRSFIHFIYEEYKFCWNSTELFIIDFWENRDWLKLFKIGVFLVANRFKSFHSFDSANLFLLQYWKWNDTNEY